MTINKVATEGCEIRNENNEIVAWSIDGEWASIIVLALEMYLNEVKNNG